MLKNLLIFLAAITSISAIADDENIPKGFEYILEQGMEVDVFFNGDQESNYLNRTSRLRNLNGKYFFKNFSSNFMNGISPLYVDFISKVLEEGLPESGLYCKDIQSESIVTTCSRDELLLRVEYDSKKLVATIYISPLFLVYFEGDSNQKSLYLGESSTADEITAALNYDLYSSIDQYSNRNNFSVNTVISKGDTNLSVGVQHSNHSELDKNNIKSQSKSNQTRISEISWSRNNDGFSKSAGLIRGYNISSSSFGSSDDILGVSFGTSNLTKQKQARKSDVDIVVLVPDNGIVQTYRDERLINTQYLPQGVQTLDTTRFPDGIYDVEVKVLKGNEIFSTQKAVVYKSIMLDDENYNIWAGNVYTKNKLTDDWVIGGSYGNKMTNFLDYNQKVTITSDVIAGETSVTADVRNGFIKGGLSLSSDGKKASNMTLGLSGGMLSSNYNLNWKNDDGSGDDYLSVSNNNLFRISERTDVGLNLLKSWSKNSYYSLSLGVNHRFNQPFFKNWNLSSTLAHTSNENYWALSLDIPLSSSASLSSNANADGLSLGAGYSYSDSQAFIKSATITAENKLGDDYNYNLRTTAFFENDYIDGNIGGSVTSTKNSNAFANITGGVYLPGGPASGRYNSAIVLNVEEENVGKLKAITGYGDVLLDSKETIIPVPAYSKNKVTIDVADNNEQLFKIDNSVETIISYPGNVKKIDVNAHPVFTVTGRLVDKVGNPLAHQSVINHLGASYTSEEGVFTLEVSGANPTITWFSCEYDLSSYLKGNKPYLFLGNLSACDKYISSPDVQLAELNEDVDINTEEMVAETQSQHSRKGITAVDGKAYVVQYASVDSNLDLSKIKWIQDAIKRSGYKLIVKLKTNDRIALVVECTSSNDCVIDKQLMNAVNRTDAYITSYKNQENYFDFVLDTKSNLLQGQIAENKSEENLNDTNI
ncbi:hypothetical protein BVJ60_17400 [Vibrio cholerae]|uniref:TcfC E-set like domain-containing protein n=1 Tax=Vibrio cholerae TaxID=666 RepID=UPI00096B8291|nr:TcfC E-set like domain-containing protein [Vibrio cholerae]MBO1386539.1 hypothetical protein [Vibrio cholerae]WOQ88830.1 TcfC E-set like domain-containing protein [Vibrio cholerae]